MSIPAVRSIFRGKRCRPFAAFLAAFGIVVSGACAVRAGCKTDVECPKGQVCASGECQATMCTQDWSPVCGEDGRTYSNACHARIAHVIVKHDGECTDSKGQPKICGTIAGIACDIDEYCDLQAGICRGADLQGFCVPKQERCPEGGNPVCGCDGRTYDNDCARIRAEIQKDHDGACRSSEGR